jgi:hypothetical protein
MDEYTCEFKNYLPTEFFVYHLLEILSSESLYKQSKFFPTDRNNATDKN